LNEINKEKLIEFIVSLQQKDGSFSGDKWGNFLKNLLKQIFLKILVLFQVK
jgi:prenyltransferase beta subunit